MEWCGGSRDDIGGQEGQEGVILARIDRDNRKMRHCLISNFSSLLFPG